MSGHAVCLRVRSPVWPSHFHVLGKAGVSPMGWTFKVALLPATVQRSEKQQRLFPQSRKMPVTLVL